MQHLWMQMYSVSSAKHYDSSVLFSALVRSEIKLKSTTNWRFRLWLMITLQNNTIRCKKHTTIASFRKNVTRPFFRLTQVSTSAEIERIAEIVAILFRQSCLPVFAWRRIVLRFLNRNSCCEFLATDGVILQNDYQS